MGPPDRCQHAAHVISELILTAQVGLALQSSPVSPWRSSLEQSPPSEVPFLKTSTLVSYLPPGLWPVASLRLSFNCLHFIFSLPVYYSSTCLLLQNLDCPDCLSYLEDSQCSWPGFEQLGTPIIRQVKSTLSFRRHFVICQDFKAVFRHQSPCSYSHFSGMRAGSCDTFPPVLHTALGSYYSWWSAVMSCPPGL